MKRLVFILALPVALLLLPSTIVLLASLLPTLVAFTIDDGKKRHLTVTVLSFNLAGSCYFLRQLWKMGQDIQHIAPALSNEMGWFCALGGAALGWMIFLIVPGIWAQISKAQSSYLLFGLRREQKKLVDLWGDSVKGEIK